MLQVVIWGWQEGAPDILRRCRDLQSLAVRAVVLAPADFASLPAEAAAVTRWDDIRQVQGERVHVVFNLKGAGVDLPVLGGHGGEPLVLDGFQAERFLDLVENLERHFDSYKQASWEYEAVLNSTHDAMLMVDARGTVKLFNAAAERITGIKADSVLGKKVDKVIPNSRLPVVLRTGQPELNRQQEVGKTTIITNRMPVRDDQGSLMGAVAVFRDITEIKSLAEEITNLKEIRHMLEAIIDSTQDAISVVDEKGIGLLINPAYTRLTGLTESDVIGKPASVDIAEGESVHLRVLKTRSPVRGAVMKVGPQKREVVVHVAPIMVDDSLKGSVAVIHDISEIQRLHDELERARRRIRLLEAKYTFEDIVGESMEIKTAVEQARRAAETPATVLLRGESGTGKELFAHAIHNASCRKKGQFIRVNCSAIAESLLESELFGYDEGAFTGARRGGKKGLFEEANGGTILLDEIAEIHPNIQAKLLRVLQEREIIRVGSTKPIPVDVRVIAATNTDLERAVARGAFREDLYYRINVVPIYIPPLRRRKEDVPLLVHYLLRKYNQEYGRSVESVSTQALQVLKEYDWPGNVRELENILGRAMINMRFNETVLKAQHLPLLYDGRGYSIQKNIGEAASSNGVTVETLQSVMNRVEKRALNNALQQTGGNKTAAAQLLGISIRSLYYKLEKYGIQS